MKKVKAISIIVVSIFLIYLLLTKLNYDNSDAFNSILTFLSIIAGFSITALSIIATSDFSKELYAKESKKNNSLTLLHELIAIFKNSTLLFISTIIVILIYEFLPNCKRTLFNLGGCSISMEDIMKTLVWYLTILCFSTFIYLLLTFSRFVIKSVAKKHSKS